MSSSSLRQRSTNNNNNKSKPLKSSSPPPPSTSVEQLNRIKAADLAASALPKVIPLEKVENFRDLGGYTTKDGQYRVKRGCVYRTARMEQATPSDRQFLETNIRTIIDLRDTSEQRKTFQTATPSSKRFYAGFEYRTVTKDGTLVKVDPNDHHGAPPMSQRIVRLLCRKSSKNNDNNNDDGGPIRLELNAVGDDEDSGDDNDDDSTTSSGLLSSKVRRQRQRFLVPIGPTKSVVKYMKQNMSCGQKLQFCIDLVCCCSLERAVKGVLPVFNALGLYGMTEMITRDRHAGIATVLKLIAQPRLHPVVFHCMHGKDRTGLVGALVLHLCDVPHDRIMHDYAQSERHLGPEMWDETLAEFLSDEWKMSPPRVMRDIFALLEKEYGSVEEYCTAIGFGPQWQQQLRAALLEENTDNNNS